jgi:exodeoxyribonuclease VII large subunit
VVAAKAAAHLSLRFHDGPVDASIDGSGSPRSVEPKRRRSYIAPQPGLFDPAEE